ncbi:hypothetical protein FOCC_FOCC002436 [Frankliniella occidentalis]|uniref:Serine protease 3 n=1 Tax=Frankliniella occidentalis TaxID=133901 RepID=A0A6J1T0C4_FRAOC|nr:serine protease 3 [Frankliniella occidentalis]KAE8751008.1 hypothetical protein FOCC_FOCC002436 [Frankliniella occidentalis]
MWRFLVLLVVGAVAAQAWDIAEDDDTFSASAVPTNEAAPGQFPYQVGIWASQDGITSQLFCSGAILTKNTVITSAHCAKAGRYFTIVFGVHNISDPATATRKTSTKLIHEKYVDDRAHDIALMHFETPIAYWLTTVKPVNLPSAEQAKQSFWKSEVTTSGWGVLKPGDREYSQVLRFAKSKVVHNLWCTLRYFFQRVYKTNICVKSIQMCQGDSGNPLVIYGEDNTPTLVGIASFGVAQSCEMSKPARYTRITSYLKWIQDGIETLEKANA